MNDTPFKPSAIRRSLEPRSIRGRPRRFHGLFCRVAMHVAMHAAGVIVLLSGPFFDPTYAASDGEVWAPGQETSCSFGAWTNNRRRGTIEVRAAPSEKAAVVGTLPATTSRTSPDYEYSTRFDVIAADGAWLKIDHASDDENARDGVPPRIIYEGEGWISSDSANVQIQSGRGYARPDIESRRLVDLHGDWLTEMGSIDRVSACSDAWLLLDFTLRRRRNPSGGLIELAETERVPGRAWFRGICSVEETTCDMRSVDSDAPAAKP